MEEMILEKVAQKENELNATYDERLRNYEERFVASLLLSFRAQDHCIQGARFAASSIINEEPTPRSPHVQRLQSS